MTTQTRSLDGSWSLRSLRLAPDAPVADVRISATVPGSVHLDLLAAGLIADPFVDTNEDQQHWVGWSDWEFSRSISLPPAAPGERVELVFHGLDTVATVVFDQQVLGRTENMHRTYRFDITDLLTGSDGGRGGDGEGGHLLAVRFDSPVAVAAERRDRLGDLPNPYGQPYNFIRKMACNFGWDWGPRLTTSAIWRSVEFVRWRVACLGAVRAAAHIDAHGVVELVAEVRRGSSDAASSNLRLAVDIAGRRIEVAVPHHSTAVTVRVEVPDVERWWPSGRGAQPLYDLSVTLIDHADRTHDHWTRRVGFRNVAIDRAPDAAGERFAITVNGERVWVRGVNWIPAACFPGELQRADYRRRLTDAVDAGCNLIRVWGGGLYEDDRFYDVCDELGLLVWQDFLFACAAYPEELLAAEVEAEAVDNIGRLMSHPSLALWCGNNENLWGWEDWGWKAQVGERTWGAGFYEGLLPDLVGRLDPSRPYIPGSPFSSGGRHPNDAATGPVHIWDVWNERDYVDYLDFQPRFVSEFGFQAPATYATLSRVITERPINVEGAAMGQHQKAFDGVAKLQRWLDAHFGPVEDLDDWWFLTQLNQARAIETGVGHFRSLHDHCSGVIWWQLNDCWPVVSWSIVDVDGRRKPSWYATRRAFADRTVVFDTTGDELSLVLLNDTRTKWTDPARLSVVTSNGAVHRHEFTANVPADGTSRIAIAGIIGSAGVVGACALVADVGAVRRLHLVPGSTVPKASWTVDRQPRDGGAGVIVTAATLVIDLCLFADRLHPSASVDSQLVHLLPGESHRFEVDAVAAEIDWSKAGTRPVLRSSNDR